MWFYIFGLYVKLMHVCKNEFVIFSFLDVTVFIYSGFNSSVLYIRLMAILCCPNLYPCTHIWEYSVKITSCFIWKTKLKIAQVKVRVELSAVGQYTDTGNTMEALGVKYKQNPLNGHLKTSEQARQLFFPLEATYSPYFCISLLFYGSSSILNWFCLFS